MQLRKKITIITANYSPEDTAIGLYTSQLSEHLIQAGFEVNVITGFPYYPQWEIYDAYKAKKKYFQENLNGVNVYRYRQYVPKSVNFAGRVRMMLSLLKGTFQNAKKIHNTDLVFCIVPFTTSVWPAIRLAQKHNAKLWVHVQDLEFDLAFESGVLKRTDVFGFMRRTLFSAERIMLKKADIVSTISYNMTAKIRSKVPTATQYYLPNWVSTQLHSASATIHSYINSSKFTILYSGNIGEKQDWDILHSLCSIMLDSDIEILIVGDGAARNSLQRKLSAFDFVRFMPPVPFNELNDLLCSANMHFLFQKQDVVDTIMPSKILGMMASGKPSLITGNANSEVAVIMKESEGGYYLSNVSAEDIYSRILEIKNSSEVSKQMGQNAQHYILNTFSQEKILNNFHVKVNEILNENIS